MTKTPLRLRRGRGRKTTQSRVGQARTLRPARFQLIRSLESRMWRYSSTTRLTIKTLKQEDYSENPAHASSFLLGLCNDGGPSTPAFAISKMHLRTRASQILQ